jgi:hypothetical protein
MRPLRSSEVLGVAADTLRFAREPSRETHSNEYVGFLRGEDARPLGLGRDGTPTMLSVLEADPPDDRDCFEFTGEDLP